MAKLPHLVMEDFTKAKSKAEKIAVLRSNESWALKDILRLQTRLSRMLSRQT